VYLVEVFDRDGMSWFRPHCVRGWVGALAGSPHDAWVQAKARHGYPQQLPTWLP
jgi:hypothetical protein